MNRMLTSLLVCVAPLQVWAGEPPVQAELAETLGTAVARLTASLDRLAVLLEKEVELQSEEKEARRVEVAVGIMGLRYRKIDRLEAEIERINREEEEFPELMQLIKADMERLDKQGRAESGQLSEEARDAIAKAELQVRMEEQRITRVRERRLGLQNDLMAEQRRLASLEAVLDAWMEKQ